MTGNHQRAGGAEVAVAQRCREIADSLVLADHVLGAGPDDGVGDRPCVAEGGGAQRADDRFRCRAFGDAVGVRAAGQGAVGDELHDDVDVVGDLDRFDRDIAAIDQQGVTCHTGRDHQLVHDPARHSRRPDLGAPAQLRQAQRVAVEAERQRHRQLERGTARQTGADRDVGCDGAVDADRRAHLGDHAGDVLGPLRLDGAEVVDPQVEQGGLRLVVGEQGDGFGGGATDLGPAVDGHRQHHAAGVVGVIADQVDPSGSADVDAHANFRA